MRRRHAVTVCAYDAAAGWVMCTLAAAGACAALWLALSWLMPGR